MKKLVLTTLLAATVLYMQAQKVTFLSEGFEFGVKAHLGLSESDEVQQTQTDTITSIDLSGRGICESEKQQTGIYQFLGICTA